MGHFDALFAINQNVDPAKLAADLRARGMASALLLTTHRLFPNEREELISGWGGKLEMVTFSDLLGDADLCRCDESARASLLAEGVGGNPEYNGRFMAASLLEKNRLAYLRLCSEHRFGGIYYQPGLGIAPRFWQGVGAELQLGGGGGDAPPAQRAGGALAALAAMARASRRLLTPKRLEVSVLQEGETRYLFLSPLKRLTLRRGVTVVRETISLSRLAAASRAADKKGRRLLPCMTVHGYDPSLARALGGVLVFVDGYHPANYPPAYLDGYGAQESFVPRTMYDARWFAGHGGRIEKPPGFVERQFFASCAAAPLSRVLVAFNHAGDWTSLISRSDTDQLVTAVVELARRLPQLSFRMRLHPTMDHPAHEGAQASQRIARFVRGEKLPNLQLSGCDLEEDLAWCQLCLSEYSQVLLDAWRGGKLGAAVNLTGRRSFMQDYADLGFSQASSEEEALEMLRAMTLHPEAAASRQNEAVRRYNLLLSSWLKEATTEGGAAL